MFESGPGPGNLSVVPDAAESPRRRLPRWVPRAALVLGVGFLAIQLVPYGWKHDNPPVVQDAPWPTEEAAAIARTSCYDCHSNETEWPAYSYVAPMSWLVRRDIDSGRHELNFSHWNEDAGEADDAADAVSGGSMPPRTYTVLHPDARLTDEEADQLVAALEAMDEARGGGSDGGGDNSGRGSGDDEILEPGGGGED